jgi:hypothetical protein
VGFILTTFQKLNASSFRAIKAALEGRLARLEKKVEELPEEEAEDRDERFEGELDEKDVVLKTDREFLKDEIKQLRKLLAIPVTRERKIDSLRDLLKKIDTETPGAKVLIFTEYRRTQEFLKERLEKWYGANTVVLINGSMELEGKTAVRNAGGDTGATGSGKQAPQPARLPRRALGAVPGFNRGGRRRNQPAVLPHRGELRPALESHALRAARGARLPLRSG